MPTRNLKLTIAYEGSRYAGWQIQPDRPTIQGELQTAFQKLTGERATINGAGRTDAGVHALGQVANLHTASQLPLERLQLGLNHFLPDEIAIQDIADVPAEFHATLSARRKTYRYCLHASRVRNPFNRRFAWRVSRPLDLAAMQLAATHLVGTHDFCCFETVGSPRSNTIRTLFEAAVFAHPQQENTNTTHPEQIAIEVTGDGFLYNMVRTIAGTLAEVGWGKQPPHWVADLIRNRHRPAAGQTAPPQGLFLVSVNYDAT